MEVNLAHFSYQIKQSVFVKNESLDLFTVGT